MLEKYNLDNATTNKVTELDKQYRSKYNTTFTKVIKKKLFPTNKGENKRKLALFPFVRKVNSLSSYTLQTPQNTAIAEKKSITMKLGNLYKVYSQFELNSCPDSSVGWSV